MAVASTYSTEGTNHTSVAGTKNNTTQTEGVLKTSAATVSVAAADDDGSKYFLVPVYSKWNIRHIWLYNDAITNGTVYDVGLYTTAATPVAVDDDCYATDIDLSSARTTSPIDLRFEALNITTVNDKVHTNGSVTTDPAAWYWLAFTAGTVGTAQGDITVIVEYVE
jgi:hypothetical protein